MSPGFTCPYGTPLGETHMRCEKFRELTGYVGSVEISMCQMHMKAGGPESSLEEHPRLRAIIAHGMKARLIAGNSRRYDKSADPLDLAALAAKIKDRSTREELEVLFERMVTRWARIPEDSGGDTAAVIEAKARQVAAIWEIAIT